MKTILSIISGLFLFTSIVHSQIVRERNIAKYYFNNSSANDEVGVNDGVIFS